jgi:predicted nucleic acid-binding protein
MNAERPRPLFVDTGALYARFVSDDDNHETAMSVFDGIRDGELPYRPLYTTRYVLSELTRLLLYRKGHEQAVTALRTVEGSAAFVVLSPTDEEYEQACERFAGYEDQEITLVDHLTGVMADSRDVERVFGFDSDFQTLGFDVVPEDTGGV